MHSRAPDLNVRGCFTPHVQQNWAKKQPDCPRFADLAAFRTKKMPIRATFMVLKRQMSRPVRKQTHSDYSARVYRVNQTFHARNRDRRRDRPFAFWVMGFAWCYIVLTMATRNEEILASLKAGSLPPELHNLVLSGMAVLIGISCVLLLFHIARIAIRRPERRNSTSLVFGALVALGLMLTPASVFQAGYAALEKNTRGLVTSTQTAVRGIDWNDVVLVSSQIIRTETAPEVAESGN